VKDELDKQARFFELGERYYWFSSQNTIVQRTLEPVLAELATTRRPHILDLGCGPGNTLRRLMPLGRVFGSDFSLDALRFARTKGITSVFSADSVALPIGSGNVDCVVALDVLEHVEDDRAALAEIRRVLRPGGAFLFTVPTFMALWRHHDVMYGHFRRYRRQDFIAAVRHAGLSVRGCHFIKCAAFAPLWLLARLERLGLVPARDNFFAVPEWVNRALEAEIVWETRSGLAAWLPFGVSLLCVGARES
jgi:SAM-dependent methyltransferase